MIGVLGVKKGVSVDIREKLSIIPKHYEDVSNNLLNVCEEIVVLSTCNRTEIYFNSKREDENLIEDIFNNLGWKREFCKYTFYHRGEEAAEHLMKVICGFDSQILGEDQILGQVKNAYETALKTKSVKRELQRLFQLAITCGKEFRCKTNLYKIPVCSSSISVNEARKNKIRKFMILGYGEMGSLTAKYILSGDFNVLYIAVRNVNAVDIEDDRVKVIPFNERQKYYEDVDCIISCTSAPHYVVKKDELPDKEFIIFDLAVPRDVEEGICCMEKVKVYNIDQISLIDDENKKIRKEIMLKNRYLIDEYMEEFLSWKKIREISPKIQEIQESGERIYKKRYKTFRNKKETKDHEALAKMLLKSTSNAFVNRAIEVLKEEKLKGRGDECLRIIEKIFLVEN